ncbi:hypothetical protein EIP86_008455 [Pleurotus ostreatoroseus]|nr:hypothetical protein EIP86_008455 [Pleurotus ostreatoroseus]
MENWDDDFEFQPTGGPNTRQRTGNMKRNEILTEDIDPLSRDRKNTVGSRRSLQHWAEPGPSTPSKRVQTHADNWDDDFQDVNDSPLRRNASQSSPRSHRSRRKRPSIPEAENWDDDFEEGKPYAPSGKSARWDSSSSSEEFGFGEKDEDRTVTSRSRRGALPRPSIMQNGTPPPPVPPIPSSLANTMLEPAPFPGSPTLSSFSVPMSGRESVAAQSYSSTAHLALRPTTSGSSFGALPPSPPTHHARERRRLRKKSRPSRVDYNIYELDDRVELPLRPATPDQSDTQGPGSPVADPAPEATPQSAGKSSLVSRIGSVGKKWGAARRKRASIGPEDVVSRERQSSSRPTSMAVPSPSSASSKPNWFFRHGGVLGAGSRSPPSQESALPLKHEKSVDRLLALVGLDPETPSKIKRRNKNGSSSDLAGTSSDGGSPAFPLKRPSSVHVSGTARRLPRPPVPRHASFNHNGNHTPTSSRSSLVLRSASDNVEDLTKRRSRSSLAQDDTRTPRKPTRHSAETDRTRKPSMKNRHKHSQSTAARTEGCDGPRHSTSTTATAVPRNIPDRSDDATPRPHSRILGRASTESGPALLPPIELQPPSPPRASKGLTVSQSMPMGFNPPSEVNTPVLRPSQSSPLSLSKLQALISSPLPSPSRPKTSTSPYAASLGRSTQAPKERDLGGNVPRRNSLGDLKIPERITQAQVGLRRNLDMVRDFAANISRLKELQATYLTLVTEIQEHLVESVPPEQGKVRAASPTLFGLPRPMSRARSHTNPQFLTPPSREEARHRELVNLFRTLENKYYLSWECAELLIELGGGPVNDEDSPDVPLPSSPSARDPPVFEGRKSRERAVTLAGDESKPTLTISNLSHATLPTVSSSSTSQWRASTGRHDLSHRQLMLLRDMLNSPDASAILSSESRISEEDVNRNWRWGDAMNSTVTLPTEESSQTGSSSVAGNVSSSKKRASSRLRMRGLRDLLRSLKRTYSEASSVPESQISPLPPPSSTSVSISTDSSVDIPQSDTVAQRRRAKTSIGPESVRSLRDQPNTPYTTATFPNRSSPRRPSLASIFRLGQKGKASSKSGTQSAGSDLPMESVPHAGLDTSREPSSTHGEDEWDRIESSSDLDLVAAASALKASKSSTVKLRKGRSPYATQTPLGSAFKPSSNFSRSSIWSSDHAQDSSFEQSPSLPTTELVTRTTKLSDVQEHADGVQVQRRLLRSSSKLSGEVGTTRPSPKRPHSRASKMGFASTLAQIGNASAVEMQTDARTGRPRFSVAMTPDNIKPLLENAKEVQSRCSECLEELQRFLDSCRQASSNP